MAIVLVEFRVRWMYFCWSSVSREAIVGVLAVV